MAKELIASKLFYIAISVTTCIEILKPILTIN